MDIFWGLDFVVVGARVVGAGAEAEAEVEAEAFGTLAAAVVLVLVVVVADVGGADGGSGTNVVPR